MREALSGIPKEVIEMIEYFYVSKQSGNIVLNIKDGFILRAMKQESVQINKNRLTS